MHTLQLYDGIAAFKIHIYNKFCSDHIVNVSLVMLHSMELKSMEMVQKAPNAWLQKF